MILVVNLNASVDKKYVIDDLSKGLVMRAKSADNTPGGKGIHVANVSTILKENCIVTGFLGGKTGEFIHDKLEEYGINQDFVNIKDDTRECLAIITNDLIQTEILEPGPEVTEEEQKRFIDKYSELVEKANIVVASGSVPRNVPNNFYKKLIDICNSKNKKFLLDTSGDLLREGIKGKPFFIKPNKDEIEFLTGRRIESYRDAVREIKEFQKIGVELVAISLGAEGSIIGYKGGYYKVTVPKINAINPVGSGDSYVAGVAIGLERGYDIEYILRLASACGTANALEEETGSVKLDVVQELLDRVTISIIQN
ncbi:1-phosphofructokinase family hexose kinase [Clostridium tertium]|uniref:1-phosphofructokinase family hexose kinase n=1 Tax=Clostridium TaxID=1485 RepID=UPI001D375608|nr:MULTISPECIES: 1-phosphofructokinase family hexose kinase [Clostridium]MBS5308520.1 1-phosphofructokinase family hexose kinase [Clostridium sp.]MDB1945088.1 1-phosphofructokinase family hexose kinase [Clostridium tertium]MDB1953057.1 1-phosphofructokinase family hexose kinase [Clostridium tertium]